jgi:hypothetical protein
MSSVISATYHHIACFNLDSDLAASFLFSEGPLKKAFSDLNIRLTGARVEL